MQNGGECKGHPTVFRNDGNEDEGMENAVRQRKRMVQGGTRKRNRKIAVKGEVARFNSGQRQR
jgi:hypothetical protein